MRPSGENPEHDALAFLAGSGEMVRLTRAFDWSKTPVGPAADWPQSLKTVVRIMLDSRFAMWLGWGPEYTFFYNDAYARMTLGPKHPWALGRSAREVWAEIWPDISSRAESVVREGKATWDERLLLFLQRRGFPEETYHTFSYSPAPDDHGGIGGMLCVVTEETERTIGERRLATLRDLAERTTDAAKSVHEACETAAAILGQNPRDLPFVLLYLLNDAGTELTLAGATGVQRDSPISPSEFALADNDAAWPFREAIEASKSVEVNRLPERFGPLPGGAWPEPANRAIVLPLAKPGQTQLAGLVVAGISPRRPFDDNYRGFLELLSSQIATAVANARAYEEEKRRAEALAELDRAKTTFFSNISHELRTPLTLLLAPVADLLAKPAGQLQPDERELLTVVQRNGMRLKKLVNTLLDFSRIEAGRAQASYEPTDLAAFTAELASNFRSACERAGLELVVDCPALDQPVYVDREMWEKIVLNLLSNAFKFTLAGQIKVTLRRVGAFAELAVHDTGEGIPAEEMPRLFERFHRIEDSRGRSVEGSGIGLALVRELVRLHGGDVRSESRVGKGSTFTASLPLGASHLAPDRIKGPRAAVSTSVGAAAYVQEALRWLPDSSTDEFDHAELALADAGDGAHPRATARRRIVLAEDNADMRDYIRRLLAPNYEVAAYANGLAAWQAVCQEPPDLILSDVMMPGLDGLSLLTKLRADPRTQALPAILLSARAGEAARVEGLQSGADDYLTKPFSAKELLARVASTLEISKLRRDLQRRVGELQTLLDVLPVGIALADDPECDRVWCNPALARLLQMPSVTNSLMSANGQNAKNVDESENGQALPQLLPLQMAMATGREILGAKDDLMLNDGTRANLLNYAVPLYDEMKRVRGGLYVGVDVSELEQTQQALREAERRWRTMAEALPNLLWTDLPDGQCDWLSSQWGKYTGIPEHELLGLRWLDMVIHPDDRQRTLECWNAACADLADYDLEYRIRRYDGEYRWFKTRGVPIRDEAGKIVYWFGTCTDIEDHKRAEESLRETDRRKDEFLATLAHELRNPLAPIRNSLQILKMPRLDPAMLQQTRDIMERQVHQLIRLVDDLLDVSRVMRGKIELRKERIELATLIARAVETVQPLIDVQGHRLDIALPSESLLVEADPVRLAQVIGNLLTNSARYTEANGRIWLVAEREGDQAVLRVKDNGIGIDREVLPRVFELFVQGDSSATRSQGGLGIGLTLVKSLIEMHHGAVEAYSEGLGQGSEFILRLPLFTQPLETVAEPKTSPPTAASSGQRLLVVDDNEDAAASLAMLLRLQGHEVFVASSGPAALELLGGCRPAMIFLDIGMPGLDGYEVARRIRRLPGQDSVTLIALTGWGHPEDRRRSKEAGFDHHLVKPPEPRVVEELLAQLDSQTNST